MTIFFSMVPGFSLGQAVDAIREIEREEHLPVSIASGFAGNAQAALGHGEGWKRVFGWLEAYVVNGETVDTRKPPST